MSLPSSAPPAHGWPFPGFQDPHVAIAVSVDASFWVDGDLNSLLVFLAWNTDNILLGRFWGADALGLYGRAYQLATLPVQQLTGALGGVALSGFSGIQDDPDRLAKSFLRAYSLLVSLTIPIAISCPLFAEEIIGVVLGAKWMEVAPIFRLLAPTALVFALANPLSWLVMSTGRIGAQWASPLRQHRW